MRARGLGGFSGLMRSIFITTPLGPLLDPSARAGVAHWVATRCVCVCCSAVRGRVPRVQPGEQPPGERERHPRGAGEAPRTQGRRAADEAGQRSLRG